MRAALCRRIVVVVVVVVVITVWVAIVLHCKFRMVKALDRAVDGLDYPEGSRKFFADWVIVNVRFFSPPPPYPDLKKKKIHTKEV